MKGAVIRLWKWGNRKCIPYTHKHMLPPPMLSYLLLDLNNHARRVLVELDEVVQLVVAQ